jgi:hypothetical protein
VSAGVGGSGVVEERRSDSDRRIAYVVVTELGRQEIEVAAPGHVAAVRRLHIDRLTPDLLVAVGDAAEAVPAGFGEPVDVHELASEQVRPNRAAIRETDG